MKYLKATGIAAAILLGIGLSLGAELPGEQGAEVVEGRRMQQLREAAHSPQRAASDGLRLGQRRLRA